VKRRAWFALLLAIAGGACSRKPEPPEANDIRAALESFLREHGDVCLGKTKWPVVVTSEDVERGTSDAIQMPVLAQHGIVTLTSSASGERFASASPAPAIERAQRYELTARGKSVYLEREKPGVLARATERDLCAAHLTLERILDVTERATGGDERQTVVRYTYRVTAPGWVKEPDVERAFPLLTLIVRGEGSLALEQRFTLRNGRWLALDPRK
jgi:hypothetical protein